MNAKITFVVCLLLLPVKAIAIQAQELDFGRYYALLIANYDYHSDSKFEDLKTPLEDVRAVKDVLEERYEFDTKVVMNANRERLEKEIENLKSLPHENILIYYSGHGDRLDGVPYWVGTDDIDDNREDWIPIQKINYTLRITGAVKAKHILIVADSCYASAHSPMKSKNEMESLKAAFDKEHPEMLVDYYIKGSRNFLSSGTDEPVPDAKKKQMSGFAKVFVSLLKHYDSPISALYLSGPMISGVNRLSHNDDIKGTQTPNYTEVPREENYHKGHMIFNPKDNGVFRVKYEEGTVLAGLFKSSHQGGKDQHAQYQFIFKKDLEIALKSDSPSLESRANMLDFIEQEYNNLPEKHQKTVKNYILDFENITQSPLKEVPDYMGREYLPEYSGGGGTIQAPLFGELEVSLQTIGTTQIWNDLLFEDPEQEIEREYLYQLSPFEISISEVTYEEFLLFANEVGGIRLIPPRYAHRPVEGVSLEDAKRYANWLSEKTGQHYRLPTQGEWIAAAYSGNPSSYETEAKLNPLSYSVPETDYRSSTSVYDSAKNEAGIRGLIGGVWEWVSEEQENGTEIFGKVLGGSYLTEGLYSANDIPIERAIANKRYANVGFRLVRGPFNKPVAPPSPPVFR